MSHLSPLRICLYCILTWSILSSLGLSNPIRYSAAILSGPITSSILIFNLTDKVGLLVVVLGTSAIQRPLFCILVTSEHLYGLSSILSATVKSSQLSGSKLASASSEQSDLFKL